MATTSSAPSHARSSLQSILRLPLVQLTLLGGLTFALHHFWSCSRPATTALHIDAQKRREMIALFEQRQQRKPTTQEVDELVARWAEDEALFHEAIRIDLIHQDPALRDQLIARMRALVQASVAFSTPSDSELEAYRTAHRDRYREPTKLSFIEYLVSKGPGADDQARRLMRALQQGEAIAVPPVLHHARAGTEIAALYGDAVRDKIAALPLEQWTLVRSERGFHLVKVHAVQAGGDLSVEELRYRLLKDLRAERTKAAFQQRLAQLTARWPVRTEPSQP